MTTVRTIAGDRSLPPPFDHPHASARARAIAERGTVLRPHQKDPVLLTPRRLGASLGTGPICLEPPEFVTGVARVPAGLLTDATVPFEQYHRHTAWDRPGGTANRSGAGDLDVVVHSARTWARLALGGNPTVLLLLFVPDEEVVVRDAAGAELVAHDDRFVSRVAADRFLGYLRAQRAAMTGEVGPHPNRPELVAAHGFDVKFGMHALRLGLQGVELLTTGRITLPVPEPDRSYLAYWETGRDGEGPGRWAAAGALVGSRRSAHVVHVHVVEVVRGHAAAVLHRLHAPSGEVRIRCSQMT